MSRNTAYVRLNVEGKRAWGDIFPNGLVPVHRFATQCVKLEGSKDAESVFTIDWEKLTEEQHQAILEKLEDQTGATKETILKNILRFGLPIRRGFTFGCCASETGLFS